MISGMPPQRLYVHPDEQIDLLQRQRENGKTGMPMLGKEREWVLPSHIRETWSPRRFANVFDILPMVPSGGPAAGDVLFGKSETKHTPDAEQRYSAESSSSSSSSRERLPGVAFLTSSVPNAGRMTGGEPNEWRMAQPKRVLLATLDDDSTVVYYIVHDGIVKPRQN